MRFFFIFKPLRKYYCRLISGFIILQICIMCVCAHGFTYICLKLFFFLRKLQCKFITFVIKCVHNFHAFKRRHELFDVYHGGMCHLQLLNGTVLIPFPQTNEKQLMVIKYGLVQRFWVMKKYRFSVLIAFVLMRFEMNDFVWHKKNCAHKNMRFLSYLQIKLWYSATRISYVYIYRLYVNSAMLGFFHFRKTFNISFCYDCIKTKWMTLTFITYVWRSPFILTCEGSCAIC